MYLSLNFVTYSSYQSMEDQQMKSCISNKIYVLWYVNFFSTINRSWERRWGFFNLQLKYGLY
jgi:hypothetical protein